MNLPEIEQKLLALFAAARDIGLPAEQLADMVSLAKVGEPGVALENFCTQLYEYDLTVPQSILASIAELGTAMGLEDRYWTPLKTSR